MPKRTSGGRTSRLQASGPVDIFPLLLLLEDDGDFVAVLRFLDGLQSAGAWVDIPALVQIA